MIIAAIGIISIALVIIIMILNAFFVFKKKEIVIAKTDRTKMPRLILYRTESKHFS